jgi:hypothetical protein
MPQKDLTTDEIMKVAKGLTKEVKKKESEQSQLIGRKDSLYERLEKELGHSTLNSARKELKKKEKQRADKKSQLLTIFTELKERKEWAISIREITNS